jgi:hypothetical protein
MSITRLQQARQMYAQGQRVSRAFGGVMGMDGRRQYGGGSDSGAVSSGYQGGGRDEKGNVSGSAPGAGSSHNSNTPSGADDRSSDTQQYNHYEVMNEYNPMKEDMLPGDVPDGFIKPEDATNLGLNLRPYEQQRVDFLNTPYKPLNLPTPMGGAINFLGGLGHKKNTQFFADNVAGNYGYTFDPTQTGSYQKAYERYMRDRAMGKANAYGRPFTEEELRNQVGGGDGGNTGIMTVSNTDDGDADGDGDVDQDDFIFRYFDKTGETLQAGAGGVQDLMKSIRERISNIFS